MLSKSSIHFSVEGWGCIPPPLFYLKPNLGGGHEAMGTSFSESNGHLDFYDRSTFPSYWQLLLFYISNSDDHHCGASKHFCRLDSGGKPW